MQALCEMLRWAKLSSVAVMPYIDSKVRRSLKEPCILDAGDVGVVLFIIVELRHQCQNDSRTFKSLNEIAAYVTSNQHLSMASTLPVNHVAVAQTLDGGNFR